MCGGHGLRGGRGQAVADFVPEAVVRPVLNLFVWRHLDIVAAARGRAHGAKRKAARMIGVDELVTDGRNVRDDAEPGEGIDFLVDRYRPLRHGAAADAVIAVAAGDEVAVDAVTLARAAIGDEGALAVEIVRLDVLRLVNGKGT